MNCPNCDNLLDRHQPEVDAESLDVAPKIICCSACGYVEER